MFITFMSLIGVPLPLAKVKFSVSKTDLFDGKIDGLENKLTFKNKYPSLGAFRLVLDTICEELVEYALWPVSTKLR